MQTDKENKKFITYGRGNKWQFWKLFVESLEEFRLISSILKLALNNQEYAECNRRPPAKFLLGSGISSSAGTFFPLNYGIGLLKELVYVWHIKKS